METYEQEDMENRSLDKRKIGIVGLVAGISALAAGCITFVTPIRYYESPGHYPNYGGVNWGYGRYYGGNFNRYGSRNWENRSRGFNEHRFRSRHETHTFRPIAPPRQHFGQRQMRPPRTDFGFGFQHRRR